MNWLDLFGDEGMFVSLDTTGYISDVDLRAAACEDDVEAACPYVGMLPAESNHEGGSPLNFGDHRGEWVPRTVATTLQGGTASRYLTRQFNLRRKAAAQKKAARKGRA